MKSRRATQKLRETAEALRILCPTRFPVQVRRAKIVDGFGDCELTTKGRRLFKIRINSSLDVQFQIWVLVHEWAHAMTWDIHHARHPDHGAHFGVAYSEAYTAIYD